MLRWKNFKDQNSRGAAVVEMSLAMPALLVTLFGTVEFGRAFWIRHGLVTAAAEAARIGTRASCPRPTVQQVLQAANTSLLTSGLMPGLATISLVNTGGASGSEVTVDISYGAEFPVLSKLLSLSSLTEGSMQLTAHIEAENE